MTKEYTKQCAHPGCEGNAMETKTVVRIGDQIVNTDNIVSFYLDGNDIVGTDISGQRLQWC